MNNVQSLQRGVHNSLRSSVILFDLPRVVEELICNSVDSGATKVYVSVNVRTCYAKVEDDGSGITRDGLVILGERYATSKIHDTGTTSESLGFRGEALASLCDVSLLEIRTKARGMPNAYCKIMKGSNCLFLGIDDQREAVGTTVVVRDLFYNQPVRRNYMQASPKRVLHSIKKCVLRIALVYPLVLFKVIDLMSEDELLCTMPSSSPLRLISDGFGDEVSSSLQEVVFSDQMLILSGYISGLTNIFSTKAFQYIYINSRFVCKGPIHNLLNNLAVSFLCSLTLRKADPELQSSKRQKTQGYPAFLLNLCCPPSSYDIHFEPSKTAVEFKDWSTILSFFEQAMRHFWKLDSEEPLQGSTRVHDDADADAMSIGSATNQEEIMMGWSRIYEMGEPECDMHQHQKTSSDSSDVNHLDMSLEDADVYHRQGISCVEPDRFSWLKPCKRKVGSLGQVGCAFQQRTHDSLVDFDSPHALLGRTNNNHQWSPDIGSSLLENDLDPDRTDRSEDRYGIFDQQGKINIPDNLGSLKKDANHISLNCDYFDIIDTDDKVQFPRPCFTDHSKNEKEMSSSLEHEQCHSHSYTDHRGFNYVFAHTRNHSPFDESGDDAEGGKISSVRHARVQLKDDNCRPLVSITGSFRKNHKLDESLNGAMNSFSCEEASSYQKDKLYDWLDSDLWATNSKWGFSEISQCVDSEQSLSVKTLRPDAHRCKSKDHLASFTTADSRYFVIPDEAGNLNHENSSEVFPARHTKTEFDFRNGFSPKINIMSVSLSNQMTYQKESLSGLFNDGIGWSPSESCNMNSRESCSKYAFQTSMQIQDEGRASLLDELECQNSRPSKVHKIRSKRSCSAPPFYKTKCRFPTLSDHLTMIAGKDNTFCSSNVSNIAPEATICSLNSLSQPPSSSQPCLEPNINDVAQSLPRKCVDEKMCSRRMDGIRKIGGFNEVCDQPLHNNTIEGSDTTDLEYAQASPSKWRTGIPQPTEKDESHMNNDGILSISSGLLHLSASSLVPESISKDCLENARVLLQLDRKFIPVMAGEILVIIDQHAADERIRLEELRRKVLSGESNSITYLDSKQELVLPEMGYQLLQKYSDQIQKWGWICDIHAQSSESFAKNVNLLKRRRCGVTLVAVPCILGTNLNDKDLIEFIEQLVETDGSSTIPPSVLRILNFKACRGAIMFGDSLLPSECSIIVEELKATSLCFQCAHGRPTTVPLLNVASLREQLAILEMDRGEPQDTWHGLRRHTPSIERARMRLESAKRFHGG